MLEPWLEPARERLARALAGDRLPHALLVHGPRGVGKRGLVKAFLEAALCRDRAADGSACGHCRGCTLAAAGTHPDGHRVGLEEDSRQLKVDQIRELARKVGLTSSEGGHQVFCIDPADRLNVAAANALLKTLEEPRPGTLLVLLAERPAALPVTVLSRCQQIALTCPAREEALAWLSVVGGDDGSEAEREAALTAAGGSPGVARELLAADLVGTYGETLDDLLELAASRADPVEVAGRWAAGTPELRLLWMGRSLTEAAWCQARSQARSEAHPLTGLVDLASLSALGGAVDRTRALLDSNLRPEQLLEGLLLQWTAGRVRKAGGRSW